MKTKKLNVALLLMVSLSLSASAFSSNAFADDQLEAALQAQKDVDAAKTALDAQQKILDQANADLQHAKNYHNGAVILSVAATAADIAFIGYVENGIANAPQYGRFSLGSQTLWRGAYVGTSLLDASGVVIGVYFTHKQLVEMQNTVSENQAKLDTAKAVVAADEARLAVFKKSAGIK